MQNLEDVLQERLAGIDRTGGDKASQEQRHLDHGSDERTYWHYGYASALRDVLRIIRGAGNPVN
jgi:hypothetical protein